MLIPSEPDWAGQFLVGNHGPVRSGWTRTIAIGDYTVYLYPGVDVVEVHSATGELVGAFLGTLIDYENQRVIDRPVTFAAPARLGALDQAIESFAYQFGGSWALVLGTAPGMERIYLDCNGSRSLVFDPTTRIAAATAGLLFDDDGYRERFENDLYDALSVKGEGWFPSGLTAHRGVDRLLCNHYLDLNTFVAVRHWPVGDFAWTVTAADAADRVADIVQKSTAALVAHGQTVSALTGGNESRFLLAANRPICHELDYVTVSGPETRRDVVLAERLVAISGIRHRLLPVVKASASAQQLWRFRSGHCVTGPNMVTHPSIDPLSDYSTFIGGLGGEIGRAFFWRSTDDETSPMAAEQLTPRFGMARNDRVLDATASWLGGLEGMNALSILDLAYLELRMSAWGFANAYASTTVAHLHPMICREVYDLMLRLPPAAKRENSLILEGVNQRWPELMTVPINSYGDYRDVLGTARRAVTRPNLVLKKLRKLWG